MAITLDISDQITPANNRLREGLSPARLNPPIGAAVKKTFQNHFLSLGPNRNHFPTTHFWPRAAKATRSAYRETYEAFPYQLLLTFQEQG